MRWLVTGASGQLGHHLLTRLGGEDVVGLSRAELDITDAAAVAEALDTHRPDVVLNAAAYTAVDAAESDEATALAVNGTGPATVAAALRDRPGRLVHISTDYVFSGEHDVPYEPGDPVGPRTAYGRSKLAGERAVCAALPERAWIVRTAWVHGGPGRNFVSTMLRLEAERETLTVVDDQIGSPTWAGDLAAALVELGRSDVPGGTLHFANAGQGSWFDLARAVFEERGADPSRIQPISSDQFPVPAPRPAWSVLSSAAWVRAGLSAPRPWREAVVDSVASN